MNDAILNSMSLRIRDIRSLVADLDEEQMTAQPVPGMNHPAWTIGHVVYSFQAIGEELGIEPWLSEEWIALFGQGRALADDPKVYPNKQELLTALDDGQERIVRTLKATSDETLAGPLPDVRYREMFPTLGHAVMNCLAGHLAIHVGQLGAWRRAMRLPSGS